MGEIANNIGQEMEINIRVVDSGTSNNAACDIVVGQCC